MSEQERRTDDFRKDVEAFTKDTSQRGTEKPELTEQERNNEFLPQPLVKIVNYRTGDVIQASLEELNQQMLDFHKVILLIEDDAAASDACTRALHELGYDGVQLITHILHAENHLEDIVTNLTEPPAAIILDLGLGHGSGFTVLRKCHSEPRLQHVPILVWTKHTDDLSKTFSSYLGAQDYLVKSDDPFELSAALKRLMAPNTAQKLQPA